MKGHPRAADLVFSDGRPAPASVRMWAATDACWPDPFSSGKGTVPIATPDGVLIVKPMSEVFRWVCLESIAEEIEGDDDTTAYLEELASELTAAHPGVGVLFDPHTQPDTFLWFAESGPMVLVYERDAITTREPFEAWCATFKEP